MTLSGTISGRARIAGVMGWPVSHSRSPRLHNYWLGEYGVDGAYIPLPVRPEDFDRAVRALPSLGFAGANVTVPHKQAAFRAMDHCDDLARRLGAVNTIVVGEDGALRGQNTDVFGFTEALAARAPGWKPSAGAAVVLGAGGASRAILAALQDLAVPEIRLLNRTFERARDLAAEFGAPITASRWEDRESALDGAALLVNTTLLGMRAQPALDIRLDALPVDAVVNDIVYVPLETPLLAQAAARGNVAVDGLEMLLQQARPGFEAWFGCDPAVTDDVRSFLREGLD